MITMDSPVSCRQDGRKDVVDSPSLIDQDEDKKVLSSADEHAAATGISNAPSPACTTSSSLASSSGGAISEHLVTTPHHHPNNDELMNDASFVTSMHDVAALMREQDADLLESMHSDGPNASKSKTNKHHRLANSRGGSAADLAVRDLPSTTNNSSIPETTTITATTTTTTEQQQLQQRLKPETADPSSATSTNLSGRPPKSLASSNKSSPDADGNQKPLIQQQVHEGVSTPRTLRRALSGEVWTTSTTPPPPPQAPVFDSDTGPRQDSPLNQLRDQPERQQKQKQQQQHREEENATPEIDAPPPLSPHQQKQEKEQEAVRELKRTESMDRRLSEAVQFAEAIGEYIDLEETSELPFIEEDRSDDDDDDDDDEEEHHATPEIHVRPSSDQGSVALSASTPTTPVRASQQQRPVETSSSAASACNGAPVQQQQQPGAGQVVPLSSNDDSRLVTPPLPLPPQQQRHKKRPTWPFSSASTVFLHELPDNGSQSCQDYVYKGIRSNPPEIVKRGMKRGNYAQLHRKAWLEVSDKYHRYGKHLRLYYRHWESLGCPTNMFFDWLDSKGDAAGQRLPELEECPRSKLDCDTVLYITNPAVTDSYAVTFKPDAQGRGVVTDVDGDPVQTGPEGWIFVLRDNKMYGARKVASVTGHSSKQRFHHSSFFGGKAVAAAGIFITDDAGKMTRLYPHSGHYRPGEPHVQRVLFFLYHAGVDLRTFEMDTQQILHVSRDKEVPNNRDATKNNGNKNNNSNKNNNNNTASSSATKATSAPGDGATRKLEKPEKKTKVESLYLMPAVLVACFLAHKARFIGHGTFNQIHQIHKTDVTSVTEALELIDDGGHW